MESGLIIHAPPDDEVPLRLIELGWKQGVVFKTPELALWSAQLQAALDDNIEIRPRPDSVGNQWVVISQTCDIAASLDKEPVVEACACEIETSPTTRASYRRSYRRYEIDRATGLVARAMDKVAFDKRTLLRLTPEPWPDSQFRLSRFSTWLGRRASREAIPNPVVEAFVEPFQKVLDRLKKKQPALYRAFNESVREIRIRLPETDIPPFLINMILLLENDLSGDGDDAIEEVLRRLRSTLKTDQAELGNVEKLTGNRMSVTLLDATCLVDLEAFSYEVDNVVGAEPIQS